MLPLAGPAVATVFILTFLAQWNDLLKPLVFNSSSDMYTLQQGLAVTLNKGANLVPNVATLVAGVVLASIVPVVMFLIGQKWFARSVASTGLKRYRGLLSVVFIPEHHYQWHFWRISPH